MWQESNNSLNKSFNFPDFKTALEFVRIVGGLAEDMNHHPDIELSWGKVEIHITTHSANGVTEKDHELADKIDQIKG